MIDREEAVKRCVNCIYCDVTQDTEGLSFLGCQFSDNKWIVDINRCPITEGRKVE